MSVRDCPAIPSTPNTDVLRQVYAIAKSRGADDRMLLATFETAWVETRVNNLDCGDQDSVGVFQQRPSQGWGSVEQIMDIVYSTNKFLDGLIPAAQQSPGLTAGQLAQYVQRSDFPFRYDEAESVARVCILIFFRVVCGADVPSSRALSLRPKAPIPPLPRRPHLPRHLLLPLLPQIHPISQRPTAQICQLGLPPAHTSEETRSPTVSVYNLHHVISCSPSCRWTQMAIQLVDFQCTLVSAP